MAPQAVTRMRLERLADERDRTNEKIEDLIQLAEEEQRDLADYEQEQVAKYRMRAEELESEIILLAADVERVNDARDVSRLVREDDDGSGGVKRYATARSDGPIVYRTFAEFARDEMIVRFPEIANLAAGPRGDVDSLRGEAQERLVRVVNTLSSNVAGLVLPTHMTQIMDIIDASRPVVSSGRDVPLDRGSLTYPKIDQRPQSLLQSSEKTEGGTANMQVSLKTVTAEIGRASCRERV